MCPSGRRRGDLRGVHTDPPLAGSLPVAVGLYKQADFSDFPGLVKFGFLHTEKEERIGKLCEVNCY